MKLLQIRKLSFQYENSEEYALQNVSIDVDQGEIICITGESGCGKTTLLRCLNGLIPEFYEGDRKGSILIHDEDIFSMPQYQIAKYVGSVFQDPRSQFFTVNTTDEIAFGCENLSWNTENIITRVENTFQTLEMNDLRDRSIFSLSSGEKQKIAIGSVYAMNPEIMLLDEPSANLDAEAAANLKQLIRAMKKAGKTLIISEHRLSYLGDIADRFIYMKDGAVQEIWRQGDIRRLDEKQIEQFGLRKFFPVEASLCGNCDRNDSRDTISNQLSVQHLCVQYGKMNVIENFDTSFQWDAGGKIVGIVGKNGSGKTTFAKTVCGLIREDSGGIYWNQKRYKGRNRILNSCFVMQDADYQLFTDSVYHEVELARDKGKSNIDIVMLLHKFGLQSFSQKHPLSLSGGQKQRLTIAAAIAKGSRILLMDEPTSGLDGRNMRNLKEILKKVRDEGKLIVIISHDNEFLDDLCDEFIKFDADWRYQLNEEVKLN